MSLSGSGFEALMPTSDPTSTLPPSGGRDATTPLYTLRWTCPRCGRTWVAAAGVAAIDRINARMSFCEQDQLGCGRCGATWEVHEVGIDWQPENQPARQQVQKLAP